MGPLSRDYGISHLIGLDRGTRDQSIVTVTVNNRREDDSLLLPSSQYRVWLSMTGYIVSTSDSASYTVVTVKFS